MFVGKARSLTNSGAAHGASHEYALALSTTNIGIGWNSLPWLTTLAYYKYSLIMEEFF